MYVNGQWANGIELSIRNVWFYIDELILIH